MIPVCHTGDREAWLTARHDMIGASDAASLWGELLGVKPFKSRSELLAHKAYRGAFSSFDDEHNLAFFGSLLEPKILEALNTGVSDSGNHLVFNLDLEPIPPTAYYEFPATVVSREHPIIGASPDAVTVDFLSGAELKNVGRYWSKGNACPEFYEAVDASCDPRVPPKYWIQCQQTMYVMGVYRWNLCGFHKGKYPLRVETICRNDRWLKEHVDRCTDFWKEVEEERERVEDGKKPRLELVKDVQESNKGKAAIEDGPHWYQRWREDGVGDFDSSLPDST